MKNLNKNEKTICYSLFSPHPVDVEVSNKPSETVPDQTMSIQEILLRHTRGQRIPDTMLGYYDDETDPMGLDGVDFNSLDLSEKYELIEAHSRKVKTMRKDHDEHVRTSKEEALKKLKNDLGLDAPSGDQAIVLS